MEPISMQQEKESRIQIEFKTEKRNSTPSWLSRNIFKLAALISGVVVFLAICSIIRSVSHLPSLSEEKLEKINKVVLYETLSLDKTTQLYQLQNKIYKDLVKESERVNFNISNQELLSMDLYTKEFSKGIVIGDKSTIDITTNDKMSIINYNNFTKEGYKIIVKQLEKKNFPKINMRVTTQDNIDKTYNIETVIEK